MSIEEGGLFMAEYRLSYKGASAVVESAGAELISFIPQNGREYIWQIGRASCRERVYQLV